MSLVKCSHCQLEFNKSYMILENNKNLTLYFCCIGCKGVYHLLKDSNLDSFYDKIGNKTLKAPLKPQQDTQNFNTKSFHKRYVKIDTNGFNSINLIIEGIHCSACIWLNEKVLSDMQDIVEATINFTTYRAKIVWNGNNLELSEIIDKIQSIGYNAFPYDLTQNSIKEMERKRDFFLRISVAIFGSINVMMIDVAKYAGYFSGIEKETLHLIHIIEFIFSTPVLFYSGWIFFRGAYYGLKNKIINMDLLISSGSLLTYIYSLYILFGANGNSYFDSVTMIITFILIGKYIETTTKNTAIQTMEKIKSKIPIEATIIKNNKREIIELDSIKIGDIVELKKGESSSVDGELISEKATFDESSLTGESLPIIKNKFNKIYSGTINIGQIIQYKAEKLYSDSTFNNIINLIEDSLSSKLDIENLANKISKYFSAIVLLISFFTFLGWYLYNNIFEEAFINSISIIIIACPCALALATPIASLVGINWARKKGLLFKEAKFIEKFSNIDTVLFDKTGTLTEGKLSVINITKELNSENISLLYSLVSLSSHPISIAIKEYLGSTLNLELKEIEEIEGKGLKSKYKDKILIGGNKSFLQENGVKINIEDKSTVYHFSINKILVTSIYLEDEVKDGAKELILYLNQNKIKTIMITGDNEKVAKKISNKIGIKKYIYNMTPIDKLNYINSLKNKRVVMVGDGLNDSLALSKADISISMGSGADISLSVSDIIVMNSSLLGVKDSFYISKRTFYFIKQNLIISLIYNIITIPVAIMGFVTPLFASISMSISSLLVILNSLRIVKKDKNG